MAINRKKSGVNEVFFVAIKALTAFNWKKTALMAFFVGIKALTAINRKNSIVNSVFFRYKDVNGV